MKKKKNGKEKRESVFNFGLNVKRFSTARGVTDCLLPAQRCEMIFAGMDSPRIRWVEVPAASRSMTSFSHVCFCQLRSQPPARPGGFSFHSAVQHVRA